MALLFHHDSRPWDSTYPPSLLRVFYNRSRSALIEFCRPARVLIYMGYPSHASGIASPGELHISFNLHLLDFIIFNSERSNCMIIDLWHIALDLLIPINKGVTMVDVDVTYIWSQKLQPFTLCVFLKNLGRDNSKLAMHSSQCHSGGRYYVYFNDPAHESTPDRSKKLRLSRGNVDTAWLIPGIYGVCIRPGNTTGTVSKG